MCDDQCACGRLMSVNVGDRRLQEKDGLLLVGSCMLSKYPEIVREYGQRDGGQAVLHICLEESHVNQAGFKIASIVRYSKMRRLTALTVDGSPHCVQLHFVLEDIRRHFTPEVETAHFVVERGHVHEISARAVKTARHLHRVEALLGDSGRA